MKNLVSSIVVLVCFWLPAGGQTSYRTGSGSDCVKTQSEVATGSLSPRKLLSFPGLPGRYRSRFCIECSPWSHLESFDFSANQPVWLFRADPVAIAPGSVLSGIPQSAKGRVTKSQKRVAPTRRAIKTDKAPQAIGPYSQAIVAGELVFAAGQIGVDPKTGEFVGSGIEEQTEQVLRNLSAVLEAAGSSTSHVVKTTVFLADMADFSAMNEVYRRHFKEDPPARSTVQVARLPRNARIEIEAIALIKKD